MGNAFLSSSQSVRSPSLLGVRRLWWTSRFDRQNVTVRYISFSFIKNMFHSDRIRLLASVTFPTGASSGVAAPRRQSLISVFAPFARPAARGREGTVRTAALVHERNLCDREALVRIGARDARRRKRQRVLGRRHRVDPLEGVVDLDDQFLLFVVDGEAENPEDLQSVVVADVFVAQLEDRVL